MTESKIITEHSFIFKELTHGKMIHGAPTLTVTLACGDPVQFSIEDWRELNRCVEAMIQESKQPPVNELPTVE